jgi:hypothetical protein
MGGIPGTAGGPEIGIEGIAGIEGILGMALILSCITCSGFAMTRFLDDSQTVADGFGAQFTPTTLVTSGVGDAHDLPFTRGAADFFSRMLFTMDCSLDSDDAESE